MNGAADKKSLRGSDLRGADLRNADLRGADLRNADFRGCDLDGADLGRALMDGADFRDTRLGNGSLGHLGGDPELTFLFNPNIRWARADDDTLWPVGFRIFQTDIIFDGPAVLALKGELVDVPTVSSRWDDHPLDVETIGQGRVRAVSGWDALLETSVGRAHAAGDKLLAANLRLLVGQPARYREEWWTIVGHDQGGMTLSIERDDGALVLPVAEIFDTNVCHWWWHVPGAERAD